MRASANHDESALEEYRQAFRADGLIADIACLSADQCALLMKHLSCQPPEPLDWRKGRAATDRLVYDIATRPKVVEIMKALLGEDVVLWGAAFVEQPAGETHVWHTDIETSGSDACSASIWIGLNNTNPKSTLEIITRSHRVGKSVQQAAVEHNLLRQQVTSQEALAWAREHDPQAVLARPVITDGHAVVFDGRAWHASFNHGPGAKRTALVLQYAAAHAPVRMPDFAQLEWPFRFKASPRPPTIAVCGTPDGRVNRVVAAPSYTAEGDHPLAIHVQPLPLPLAEDKVARWKPYPIVRGRTRTVGSMSAHISVLSPGHSPHPPHQHLQEELLVVLDGEAELVVAEESEDRQLHHQRIESGSFVYYPSFVRHTIRNISVSPVTYLMFKWTAPSGDSEHVLPWQVHDYAPCMNHSANKPFSTTTIFEGPTTFLNTLHAHTSVLQPGAGYAPHIDAHDVALVLHSGTIETLGETIDGPGFVYISAGEPHGLRNTGIEPARYLVFEFHSTRHDHLQHPIPSGASPGLRQRLRSAGLSAGKVLKRAYKTSRRRLGKRSGLLSYVIALRNRLRRT